MPEFLLESTPDWTLLVCATQCRACVAHNVAATFQRAAFALSLSLMHFPCALERQTQLQFNDTQMLLGLRIHVRARTYARRAYSFVRGRVHFSKYLLKLLRTTTQRHLARLWVLSEEPSVSHACHSMVHHHECWSLYTISLWAPATPVYHTTTRENTQHMQINAHTSTARRPPRRDEAECELQMKLKTEALLSDKWDKYAHGPSLLLTFTRCTSLTPHKWSRLLSSGINLPIYYLGFTLASPFKKALFFFKLCVDTCKQQQQQLQLLLNNRVLNGPAQLLWHDTLASTHFCMYVTDCFSFPFRFMGQTLESHNREARYGCN